MIRRATSHPNIYRRIADNRPARYNDTIATKIKREMRLGKKSRIEDVAFALAYWRPIEMTWHVMPAVPDDC